ncbi:MAG TPA: carboxypeptidase-like regulatory domain-containing protein, partial [Burkholderiaceae bacterium]|nr:carboxypeptidase-like regulatory domain-containing protein [Burkholderiaceae bacterium]
MNRSAVLALLLALAAAMLAWLLRPAVSPPSDGAASARHDPSAAPAVAAADRARDERTPLPTTAPNANDAASAPFATIRGRCVADEDGRPLAGCEVRCSTRDPAAVTAADGRFEVHVTNSNNPSLRIIAAERTPRTATWDKPLPPHAVEDLGDVRMQRGFEVRGRVVDESGVGLADCNLFVYGIEVSARAGIAQQETAGAATAGDGSFTFGSLLPAGEWETQVGTRVAYRDAPFRFHVDASAGCPPLWIVVTRGKHLRAHVVDEDGKPVALVRFHTETGDSWARSDDDGVIDFWSTRSVAGSTRILLDNDDWPDPEFVPPTVAWGSEDARLVLHRGGSLPIAVVDDSGVPVEEFAVHIAHEPLADRWEPARETGRHAGGLLTIPRVHRGPNLLRVVPRAPELLPGEVTRVAVTGHEREPVRVQLERLRVCPVQVVTQAGQP